MAACAMVGGLTGALAEPRWMSEGAMRAEFTGKALEGHFRDGRTWTGRYHGEGQFDGCEDRLCGPGRWGIRDGWFCLQGGSPRWAPSERCGAIIKPSANCYEFYWVVPRGGSFREGQPEMLWHSRGWRSGEPPTCEERPTV